MLFSFKSQDSDNPIIQRCLKDPVTQLRTKYCLYYRQAEKANTVNLVVDGRPMVLFSSNEYLGLSQHPRVKEAAKKALDEWGTSPCGSRLANGSRRYHEELEEALADFLGKEACHVLAAGYLACMTSVSALTRKDDALIVDTSIHSSLWDGVGLNPADTERFSHESMDSLASVLARLDPDQNKLIAVDGVYSMEGHIASLPRIAELSRQYKAFLVVDDAHGLGVLGKEGRGVCDQLGVTKDVNLIAGSFSKSLASTGGFVAGDRAVIEFLRTHSKQIIFSAAISAPSAAAAFESLKVLREEPEHRERVWANTKRLRSILDEMGVDYWDSPTPALPVVIGSTEKCYYVWKSLWEQGFFTVISVPPGVPAGKELIRVAVSAAHTSEQIDRFGEALATALKKAWIKPKK